MTEHQLQVITELRDAGYVIIVWTPEEIGDKDADRLEEISIERGSNYLSE